MKLLTLLLLTSCAAESTYYRMTTTNLKCPHNFFYNQQDQLCHYSKPPAPQLAVKSTKPMNLARKSAKPSNEAIMCVKFLNKCGVYVK